MFDASPFAYTEYVAGLKRTLDKMPWDRVEQVVDVLDAARLAGHQVFIFGNGGSASTASHMACDLGKNTVMPGTPRLRTLSLNDNMALFSALGNDYGYENVFVEQLHNLVDTGDVVVAISASGNSQNVGQSQWGFAGLPAGPWQRLSIMPLWPRMIVSNRWRTST